MTILADDANIIGLYFSDCPKSMSDDCVEFDNNAIITAKQWLDGYFGGMANTDIPSIKLSGTPFQEKVWRKVLKIPYGHTISYKELAKGLGMDGGRIYQAIGQALNANKMLLVIPCHRVIRSDGGLSGYAGGVERKKALLDLERRDSKIG